MGNHSSTNSPSKLVGLRTRIHHKTRRRQSTAGRAQEEARDADSAGRKKSCPAAVNRATRRLSYSHFAEDNAKKLLNREQIKDVQVLHTIQLLKD